jgi:hypothetical protein
VTRIEEQSRAARDEPASGTVTMVRRGERVVGLRVSPGHVDLLKDAEGRWSAYGVTGVQRHPVRRSRVRFTRADGSHESVYCYRRGQHSPADAGRHDIRSSLIDGLGDDPISSILLVLWLLVKIVILPILVVTTVLRWSVARRLVASVRGALDLA